MLTRSQIEQFERDGFLRGSKVVSDDEVERLRAELDRVVENYATPDTRQPVSCARCEVGDGRWFMQIVNIWEASDAFKDLVFNPRVTEEIAQLTGASELRVWHDQIQFKPPGIGGVNMWHQDSPYWPILEPASQVTAWIALDDVDEENGCMSMVPGSNHWGDQIERLHKLKSFTDLPEPFEGHEIVARACPVSKGEIHFHHGLTWHGSPANQSTRPRRAIALHYMTEKTRYVASGEHLMKPFVDVADGQKLTGDHFPLVWSSASA